MNELEERYRNIQERVAAAAKEAGRSPSDVSLIAVSKRHPPERIAELYALGHRDFGESYVQEMLEKQLALRDLSGLRWHFIGRVQRNKTKDLAKCVLVHGASALRHVQSLANADVKQVLMQVNLSGETSKNGLSPAELRRFFADLDAVDREQKEGPRLGARVKGLMTLPEPGQGSRAFAELAALRDEFGVERLPWLSMGMSGDFSDAVLKGATHIRVGTAIFGSRPA
ncbi:MAG: YggS family pyridoxal phosphate-dependent enzyme [Deltaproteobacteria bacterium]|nr:YggS family pyridoxal phosphate-dependent enzyme [Deltaproteobacteria bacterium]